MEWGYVVSAGWQIEVPSYSKILNNRERLNDSISCVLNYTNLRPHIFSNPPALEAQQLIILSRRYLMAAFRNDSISAPFLSCINLLNVGRVNRRFMSGSASFYNQRGRGRSAFGVGCEVNSVADGRECLSKS